MTYTFSNQLTTIERFILDQQRHFHDASGDLTGIMSDLTLAGKLVATRTTRAGLP